MRWVFPLRPFRGRRPVVSQEYKPGTHNGVDIMFARGPGFGDEFKRGTPEGSRLFFCPTGVDVCAAADGVVWSTSKSGRGIAITIDHGKREDGNGWVTFYTHLDSLALGIPLGVRNGAGKIRVRAGQTLGSVGFSSEDAERLVHLHFEMWKNGASSAHVDPEREGINAWPVVGTLLGFITTDLAIVLAAAVALYLYAR